MWTYFSVADGGDGDGGVDSGGAVRGVGVGISVGGGSGGRDGGWAPFPCDNSLSGTCLVIVEEVRTLMNGSQSSLRLIFVLVLTLTCPVHLHNPFLVPFLLQSRFTYVSGP